MTEKRGILADYLTFLRHHRAYWIVPLVLILLLFLVLVLLATDDADPFVYDVF